MNLVDTHDSPEQLLASLQRQRTLKLIGVVVGLIVTLVMGSVAVVLMYGS